MIVLRKDGYYVVSEHKGRNGRRKNLGGPYDTHKQAENRLKEVEYFKHKGARR